MLLNIEQISQPYSGEYEEIIFDIESNWNSSDFCMVRHARKWMNRLSVRLFLNLKKQ